LTCLGTQAGALTVTYQAVDLVDTVAGADRWRHDYVLNGDLGEFEGLSLLFDVASFRALKVAAEPDPTALSSFLEQPSPALSADGIYTISAVRPIAAERLSFGLSFDWIGRGAPGSQPYELFNADFNLTGLGRTAPVPEPASASLLVLALSALALLLRRRRARLA
jgi:hypothetical protein